MSDTAPQGNLRRSTIAQLEAQIADLQRQLAPLERAERNDIQDNGVGRCFAWKNYGDTHMIALTGVDYTDDGCRHIEGIEVMSSDGYDHWKFTICHGTAFDRMPSNAEEITRAEFDERVQQMHRKAMQRAAEMGRP